MDWSYPHTIENGAGERLTFVRRFRDERGEVLEVENSVQPGAGPPMHVHHRQEEGLTVASGTLAWELADGKSGTARAGESVSFEPGIAHRFWNAGEDELRCTGYVRPPDNVEYFLTSIYDSMRRNGGKRPDPFDVAFLATRYSTEFEMRVPPPFVQRLLFPVLLRIGRRRGRFERYGDAPKPLP